MNIVPKTIDVDETVVKGNLKNFIAIIGSTITIVASIFIGVDNINSSIITLQVSFQKQNEMNDLRYQTFNDRLSHDEADAREMRNNQNNLITAQKNNK